MLRTEAIEQARKLNKASYNPRVLYRAAKSHTGENYVAQIVNGREERRIYWKVES